MSESSFQLSDEDRAGAWGEQLARDATEALSDAEKRLGIKLKGTATITSFAPPEEFNRQVGANPHSIVAVAQAHNNAMTINRSVYLGTDPRERRQTLVHEFSHLIVGRGIPGGVPRWLDEGLAMIVSNEHGITYHARLAVAATLGGMIPIDRLWETAATGEEAQTLAYAQSLSLTRYYLDLFNKTYGFEGDDPAGLVAKLADDQEGQYLRKLLNDPNYLHALESNWKKSLNSVWTWIAAFSGGGVFWGGLTFLFLFTYWRKKQLMEEKVRQWEEEEDFSEGRDYAMYREEDFDPKRAKNDEEDEWVEEDERW